MARRSPAPSGAPTRAVQVLLDAGVPHRLLSFDAGADAGGPGLGEQAAEAIAEAGITPADLDVFIPHQANDRITDVVSRHLKLPESVTVCHDIADMGNTSAASVPIAIDRMLQRGQAHSGDLALIIGFGAGLVYAGQVIRLP